MAVSQCTLRHLTPHPQLPLFSMAVMVLQCMVHT